MSRTLKLLAGLAFTALVLPPSAAAPSRDMPVNPLGFAYAGTTKVELYARPTAMLITGRCNRYDAAFAKARAAGAEVLAYLDPVERPDKPVCKLDNEFYGGHPADVLLWPYPEYGQRVNYKRTHLTDIRPGSPWSDHVVAYVSKLMREGKVDGVFLDVVGARLWSDLADWSSWPDPEKDAWTDGNVDLVRRLDESRRIINKNFIIVTNGFWDRKDGRGRDGERYVDGVCIEHHPASSRYARLYASRTFGSSGHRRVLVIAKDAADAEAWSKVEGVTHLSRQQHYGIPLPPEVPFRALTDRLLN